MKDFITVLRPRDMGVMGFRFFWRKDLMLGLTTWTMRCGEGAGGLIDSNWDHPC